uniref:Ras-related protein Rab-14 n=1 Tax=Macrostomum lignano TaxID=282301 RepID=A0A1I8GAT8_9PLAT
HYKQLAMTSGAYNYSYIFKYIIIGDMGVGKSCLLHQFTEKKFLADCPHTIGVEFGTRIIEVSTYNHLSSWLTDARNLTLPNTVIFMIGNKSDLDSQRDVTFEEAKKFAEDNGLVFLECSAKTGENVEDAFLETARKIYENILSGVLDLKLTDGVTSRPTVGGSDGVGGGGGAGSRQDSGRSSDCAC